MTAEGELLRLDAAVRAVLAGPDFAAEVERLAGELASSSEPFTWTAIELSGLPTLPPAIRSGWIFVLRADAGSGAHFHPNSIQHMAMVRGRGHSVVGGRRRPMLGFDAGAPAAERWCVIPQGVPHEFFPAGEPMVVVSFHTCSPEELEEVACGTGVSRHYEAPR
jgi:mannose-6-phosphate isomerase-like protein (cupin superfamily)